MSHLSFPIHHPYAQLNAAGVMQNGLPYAQHPQYPQPYNLTGPSGSGMHNLQYAAGSQSQPSLIHHPQLQASALTNTAIDDKNYKEKISDLEQKIGTLEAVMSPEHDKNIFSTHGMIINLTPENKDNIKQCIKEAWRAIHALKKTNEDVNLLLLDLELTAIRLRFGHFKKNHLEYIITDEDRLKDLNSFNKKLEKFNGLIKKDNLWASLSIAQQEKYNNFTNLQSLVARYINDTPLPEAFKEIFVRTPSTPSLTAAQASLISQAPPIQDAWVDSFLAHLPNTIHPSQSQAAGFAPSLTSMPMPAQPQVEDPNLMFANTFDALLESLSHAPNTAAAPPAYYQPLTSMPIQMSVSMPAQTAAEADVALNRLLGGGQQFEEWLLDSNGSNESAVTATGMVEYMDMDPLDPSDFFKT